MNREWNDEILQQQEIGVMLLGDFNGHVAELDGGVKGEKATNGNGKIITRIMERHQLQMLNTSSKCKGRWTRMRNNSKSVIDYVLPSKEITDSMSSMYINNTGVGLANFSDHNWITVNLTTPAMIQLENRTYKNSRWNINNKTDWDNFKNVLDKKLEEWEYEVEKMEDDVDDVNIIYTKLIEMLRDTGQKTVGRKIGQSRMIRNHSINRTIKLRNRCGRKWRIACKRGNPNSSTLWKKFNKYMKKVTALKKQKERKRNKRCMENLNINNEAPGTMLWRALHTNKTNIKVEALEIDGIMKTDPNEILKEVEIYFQKLGEEKPKRYTNKKNGKTEPKLNSTFEKAITVEEVERAIRKLKNGKSGGRENIPNKFIKKGGKNLVEALRKVFDKIIVSETIPEEWSKENMHLIHKGKNRTTLDNYRGISVGSSIGKNFTKIWKERLEKIVENENYLGDTGGFPKRKRGVGKCLHP